MPGLSSSDLRDALRASFGASPRKSPKPPKEGGPRGQPSPPPRRPNPIRILKIAFTTPGSAPLPRPALGAALWSLALQYLASWSGLKGGTPKPNRELDALVQRVFGWSLAQLHVMQLDNVDPLFVLAGQFGLQINNWVPPQLHGSGVRATFDVSVQSPLNDLRTALEPAHWAKRCEVFWNKVVPDDKSIFHRRSRGRRFTGQFCLDGAPTPVSVECKGSGDDLSFRNTFTIHPDGPVPSRSAGFSGSITADKHTGKPWWTRIRHEKRMPVQGGDPDDTKNLLSYWIQVETACLMLGN